MERELHLCLDQVKAMRGLIFQGAKCENYPNGNWSARKGKAIVLVVSCMGHEHQRRARLCSMSETRSCLRRAYEGEVERERRRRRRECWRR